MFCAWRQGGKRSHQVRVHRAGKELVQLGFCRAHVVLRGIHGGLCCRQVGRQRPCLHLFELGLRAGQSHLRGIDRGARRLEVLRIGRLVGLRQLGPGTRQIVARRLHARLGCSQVRRCASLLQLGQPLLHRIQVHLGRGHRRIIRLEVQLGGDSAARRIVVVAGSGAGVPLKSAPSGP